MAFPPPNPNATFESVVQLCAGRCGVYVNCLVVGPVYANHSPYGLPVFFNPLSVTGFQSWRFVVFIQLCIFGLNFSNPLNTGFPSGTSGLNTSGILRLPASRSLRIFANLTASVDADVPTHLDMVS